MPLPPPVHHPRTTSAVNTIMMRPAPVRACARRTWLHDAGPRNGARAAPRPASAAGGRRMITRRHMIHSARLATTISSAIITTIHSFIGAANERNRSPPPLTKMNARRRARCGGPASATSRPPVSSVTTERRNIWCVAVCPDPRTGQWAQRRACRGPLSCGPRKHSFKAPKIRPFQMGRCLRSSTSPASLPLRRCAQMHCIG